jgi:hypothetical protein
MKEFYLKKEPNMPSAVILMILLILCYLGLLTGYTMGGGIHVLLVIAITVLVARVIQEKKYYNDLNRWRRR